MHNKANGHYKKVDDVHDEAQNHGILMQKQEGQVKCADAVHLNRDSNIRTVKANLPVARLVQHAPEAGLLQVLIAIKFGKNQCMSRSTRKETRRNVKIIAQLP